MSVTRMQSSHTTHVRPKGCDMTSIQAVACGSSRRLASCPVDPAGVERVNSPPEVLGLPPLPSHQLSTAPSAVHTLTLVLSLSPVPTLALMALPPEYLRHSSHPHSHPVVLPANNWSSPCHSLLLAPGKSTIVVIQCILGYSSRVDISLLI